MKNSFTKIIMVAAALATITFSSNAQNTRISLGLEAAFPMGDFGDGSGIGIGGTARVEFPLSDNIGLTGTAGYINFAGKEIELTPGFKAKTESGGAIPVQGGIKYYFNEAQEGFYAHGELGIHMFMAKVPEFDANGIQTGTKTETNTNLSFAPGIGFHLANIDIGLRLQFFSQKVTTFNPVTFEIVDKTKMYNYVGIRAAYVFGEK